MTKAAFVNQPDQSHRFNKNRRLLNAGDYKNVFDHVDCKQSGKYFTFLSTSSQQTQHRLGLVIAKKHIPLAVNRNKVKRAIRESFRCLFKQTPKPSVTDNSAEHVDTLTVAAFDVIVLAKSSTGKLDKAQLNKELKEQWQRLIQKRQNL